MEPSEEDIIKVLEDKKNQLYADYLQAVTTLENAIALFGKGSGKITKKQVVKETSQVTSSSVTHNGSEVIDNQDKDKTDNLRQQILDYIESVNRKVSNQELTESIFGLEAKLGAEKFKECKRKVTLALSGLKVLGKVEPIGSSKRDMLWRIIK